MEALLDAAEFAGVAVMEGGLGCAWRRFGLWEVGVASAGGRAAAMFANGEDMYAWALDPWLVSVPALPVDDVAGADTSSDSVSEAGASAAACRGSRPAGCLLRPLEGLSAADRLLPPTPPSPSSSSCKA